jgi:hypothetical protein
VVRRAGSDVVVGASTVQCTQAVRGNLGPQIVVESRRDGRYMFGSRCDGRCDGSNEQGYVLVCEGVEHRRD